MHRWFFTSESVTEGHPDKVADRISDAVLDAVLEQDSEGRVACETLVTANEIVVAGELGTHAQIDIDAIAREALRDIGYVGFSDFSAESCSIELKVHQQSPEIADGVSKSLEARQGSDDAHDLLGAGDQGIMFGFASAETDNLMPMPIDMAHRLAERLALVRKNGTLPYLRPDGKTQVSVEYVGDRPVGLSQVLISAQHDDGISHSRLSADLMEEVVRPVIPFEFLDSAVLLVNPSGRFVFGGPAADTGLTGRKIIVDTYGGFARHGGGAFSGKDATKVDRSAAYAARHAAKNLVAAGLAERCEVQLSYAIGQARPFSIYLDTFGTEKMDPRRLETLVDQFFDFRPSVIIERFGLRRPIFSATSAYGHFGRELPEFLWESTDDAAALAAAAESL